MDTSSHFVRSLPPKVFGIVAEFQTPHELLEGVRKARKAGFRQIDTHTPFPIHGMDQALGLKPSKLPWFVLIGALCGTATAIVMMAWMNGFDYPFRIGGKPFFAYQSYVPVAFELTVLFGAITTVLGMFALNRLPQPYHALFTHPRFARATDDAFFLSIDAKDPKWNDGMAQSVLAEAGGKEITLVFEDRQGGAA